MAHLISSSRNLEGTEDEGIEEQTRQCIDVLEKLPKAYRKIFLETINFADHCQIFVNLYEHFQDINPALSKIIAQYIIEKGGEDAFLSVEEDCNEETCLIISNSSMRLLLTFQKEENALAFGNMLNEGSVA